MIKALKSLVILQPNGRSLEIPGLECNYLAIFSCHCYQNFKQSKYLRGQVKAMLSIKQKRYLLAC